MTIEYEENDFIPTCHTCKSKIEDLPYRMVRFEDENGVINNVNFHYFFPCWDVNYFKQFHEDSKIICSGFVYDEKILERPLIVRNLEKNLDMWI